MARINPHDSWLPIEQRAAAETNPRHKKLLTEVRNHMEYEITGQLDALMGTLTASPIYHFWGGEPAVIEGFDAVRGFYEDMMSRGGQQFEVVVERIVVDDDAVITEGKVKIVHKGETLLAMGKNELDGEPLDPKDLLLTTAQLVTVWPADADGKLIGEDIYFGHDPFLHAEKISEADLPDYYRL